MSFVSGPQQVRIWSLVLLLMAQQQLLQYLMATCPQGIDDTAAASYDALLVTIVHAVNNPLWAQSLCFESPAGQRNDDGCDECASPHVTFLSKPF